MLEIEGHLGCQKLKNTKRVKIEEHSRYQKLKETKGVKSLKGHLGCQKFVRHLGY